MSIVIFDSKNCSVLSGLKDLSDHYTNVFGIYYNRLQNHSLLCVHSQTTVHWSYVISYVSNVFTDLKFIQCLYKLLKVMRSNEPHELPNIFLSIGFFVPLDTGCIFHDRTDQKYDNFSQALNLKSSFLCVVDIICPKARPCFCQIFGIF